jgi:RsmE family RNA methyltransferase
MRLEVDASEQPQPLPPLELLLGHPRPIVLKRMLRDLATIGLKRIIVAPTDLGEKSYYSSNMWQRAESLMIEGASQGGTTLLPELVRAQSLEAAIDRLAAASTARLVLHPPAGQRRVVLQDALAERAVAPLSIAIGSERGWSERELQLLDASGFDRVALGARVLRTETAATVAVWAAAEHLRRGQSSAPLLP